MAIEIAKFEHFPKDKVCKLCGTNEDKKCILIPIDGAGDGCICEGIPVHWECASNGHLLRYQSDVNIFYRRGTENELCQAYSEGRPSGEYK